MNQLKLFKTKDRGNPFFRKFIKYYFALLLIFLAFIFGLIVGKSENKNKITQPDFKVGEVFNKKAKPEFLSKDVDFNLFWDVWSLIEKNYVRQPVNETELLYGAVAGSVAALGDPHSVFFDPKTTKDFTEELKGSFEGIGAEIAIKNEKLTVVAPLPDSPAEKAGLKAGDKIFAINGEDTTSMSLDYAVNKIRGPKDTEVVLTIDFSTVVLINQGSASGSEIVAGALKDHKLATLVGEKSFGKGSVQSLFPLEDGSSVKITVAEWLTPNQNAIDGEGIEPDVKVELTDKDFSDNKDPQLDKAVEILSSKK
ncbi:MAG: S41 family peptidase [Candidatus Parcubacteria bacterium]|nr:S41 family peptidase [Candidatus Parcubacteria bacterium]